MTTKLPFTFVTYCGLPDLDADDRLVLLELERRGYKCLTADWRDNNFNWAEGGICVIRSTWDYHLFYDEFRQWLDEVAQKTVIWNSPSLVRWNSNKLYLKELENADVPVIPTLVFTKENADSFDFLLAERGWTDAVLKPSIGLSTFGVTRIRANEDSNRQKLDAILQRSEALVQPYVDTVLDRGERALVFLGGTYSHAIRKSAFQPLAQAGEAGETVVEADEAELQLAHQVLSQIMEPTIFARVDIVRDQGGADLIMEVELVEPSLYLGMVPNAVAKFADVLIAHASKLK